MMWFFYLCFALLAIGITAVWYQRQAAPKHLAKAQEALSDNYLTKATHHAAKAFYLPLGGISEPQAKQLLGASEVINNVLHRLKLAPGDDLIRCISVMNEVIDGKDTELDEDLYERLETWRDKLDLCDADELIALLTDLHPPLWTDDPIQSMKSIGDPSLAIPIIDVPISDIENKQEAELQIVQFAPDHRFNYTRFVTVNLSRVLYRVHRAMPDPFLFELCICSSDGNPEVIKHMLTFIQMLINNDAFFTEDGLSVTVPVTDAEAPYVLYKTEQLGKTIDYDGREFPLYVMVPLRDSEDSWMRHYNDKYGSKIGFKIMREWMEYEARLEPGSDFDRLDLERAPVLAKRFDLMQTMAEEIGIQIEANPGNTNWFSETQDLDYARVFQNLVGRENPAGSDDVFRVGGQLMVQERYDEVIVHYQQQLNQNPSTEDAALYQDQIGAAYFFKGEYQRALYHYQLAAEHPTSANDDNIWEVCEVLIQESGDTTLASAYLEHYPNGNHSKAAKAHLH
ncbi:hypothetical protein BGP77_11245 [Saccharospirillum sp. MSK14-1]|uniref:tetratricopeptide repeat protein n=1 Tax=Saccharospirillum sp. MSK14-1 TaxID=1897632 RepID=UPI000D3DA32F|nr:hypothetical protein [Saccharospirillum sp. MSK14-1]PTY38747.1 hypothetical protein BGP77_11245 [Saccharospirillum sp. MSK14-1]